MRGTLTQLSSSHPITAETKSALSWTTICSTPEGVSVEEGDGRVLGAGGEETEGGNFTEGVLLRNKEVAFFSPFGFHM